MDHDISEAELQRWRAAILEDEWIPRYELDQLAKHDHASLIALLHRLLAASPPKVQRVALEKLWQHGDLDDAIVYASRLPETDDGRLVVGVVAVLRASGSSAAIAALFDLAERGHAAAFCPLAAIARMPPDKLHAITLACAHVFDPLAAWRWRVAALAALHHYLELRSWEEIAIEVARRYTDEEVFTQLATWATPRVIPALPTAPTRPDWAWVGRVEGYRACHRAHSRTCRERRSPLRARLKSVRWESVSVVF